MPPKKRKTPPDKCNERPARKSRVPCDTCGRKNHLTTNCPTTAHSLNDAPSLEVTAVRTRKCKRCEQYGHKTKDCPCLVCGSTEHTTQQHEKGECQACVSAGFPQRFHDSKRGTSTKCVNYEQGLAKVNKGQSVSVITMSLRKFIRPGVTIHGNSPFLVIDWMVATCSEIAVNCKFIYLATCNFVRPLTDIYTATVSLFMNGYCLFRLENNLPLPFSTKAENQKLMDHLIKLLVKDEVVSRDNCYIPLIYIKMPTKVCFPD